MYHTTFSSCTAVSALLCSHQGTAVGSGFISSLLYFCPFLLEMLPMKPFLDAHFNRFHTFTHTNLFFCSLFLQFDKIFESFSCSLRALTAPLSLVLSTAAICLLNIPLPKSLMKILSNARAAQTPPALY